MSNNADFVVADNPVNPKPLPSTRLALLVWASTFMPLDKLATLKPSDLSNTTPLTDEDIKALRTIVAANPKILDGIKGIQSTYNQILATGKESGVWDIDCYVVAGQVDSIGRI